MNNSAINQTNFRNLHLFTRPISTYVTEGLAKIYGFQVLRHGTAFPNYLNILKFGTDPNKGGSTVYFGDVPEKSDPVYRRFHVFKDSDNSLANCVPIVGHIIKRAMPRVHATVSGISYVIANSRYKIVQVVGGIFSGIAHLFFAPVLRFVYRKEELSELFEDDPDYGNLAFRTHQHVSLSNDRIDLVGLWRNATNEDAKRAWKECPLQVIIGVIQLIIGAIFTLIGLGILL